MPARLVRACSEETAPRYGAGAGDSCVPTAPAAAAPPPGAPAADSGVERRSPVSRMRSIGVCTATV